MASGEPTVIFGDGSQVRDFVFVGDVVDAMIAAVGRRGGPYNVGTGVATSIAELHTACAKAAGVHSEPVLADARLGDVQRSVLDSSLAARELGWNPRVELADGLARSWTWMREEAP
jgi:UDP-glucose 4-epimerase